MSSPGHHTSTTSPSTSSTESTPLTAALYDPPPPLSRSRPKLTPAIQDVYRDINASGEPAIPNIKDLLQPNIKKADMNELWDVQLKKWNYQVEYLAKWREAEEQLGKELDAIIAPITPTAAVRHNQFRYYGYASAINLLDFTSVVVPVTFADKTIDVKKENYKPLNELDGVVQGECKSRLNPSLSLVNITREKQK